LLLYKTDRMAEALAIMRRTIVARETSLADAPDDPERQKDLAHSYTVLSNVLSGLNRFNEAEATNRQAFDRFQDLARRFPSVPNYRSQAVAMAQNRGRLLTLLLRYADAEAAYRVAIDLSDRLARDFPEQPELAEMSLSGRHGFATTLERQGKHRAAEEEYRKILPAERRMAAEFPDVPNLQSNLSDTLNNLANTLYSQDKMAEADPVYREAVDISRRLVARIPRQPSLRKDLAFRLANLARSLGDRPQRRDEAIGLHREATALLEELAAAFPDSPEFGAFLAMSHNNFGSLLQKMGRHAEAEAEFRRSIQVSARLVDAFPGSPGFAVTLAGTYGNLGHYLRERGRPQDALEWLGKGIDLLTAIRSKSPGDAHARDFLCNAYCWRAYALDDLGRHTEAARDWRNARELSDPTVAPKYRLGEAVSLARADGRHDRALKLAEHSAAAERIDVGALYGMACICAIASKDGAHREPYAAQAVALLRLAVVRGFLDEKLIPADADFAPLLQRADFQAVVAEAGRISRIARPVAGKPQR